MIQSMSYIEKLKYKNAEHGKNPFEVLSGQVEYVKLVRSRGIEIVGP